MARGHAAPAIGRRGADPAGRYRIPGGPAGRHGATFVVTDADGGWIVDVAAACVRVETRPIGAWTHPLREDVPDINVTSVDAVPVSGPTTPAQPSLSRSSWTRRRA
jgi:hypothetical protein